MNQNKRNVLTICCLAALVAALAALFVLPGILRHNPPPTVESLMAALDIPEVISADTLREAVQENFVSGFAGVYGIEPEPDEMVYLTKLLKENPVEMNQTEHLRKALTRECMRRRIPEETMIRQLLGIRDTAEQDKIRREWISAGLAAVLESEDFLRAMEPVYSQFYSWWTQRHPEYKELAAGIRITDDHDALLEQLTVSLRRETVIPMAQQLEDRFVTDLRKRGKVISEAKQKKAFALFVRLGRERCTEAMMRRMAEAIVTDAELTDDEILHCLLLKNRAMTEERLATIQETQVRYLEAGMSDHISPEIVAEIRKELEAISGVEYDNTPR